MLEQGVVRGLCGTRTSTIGDLNKFTWDDAFPEPFFLDVDQYQLEGLGFDHIRTVLFNGLLLCIIGSIESLMTAEVAYHLPNTILSTRSMHAKMHEAHTGGLQPDREHARLGQSARRDGARQHHLGIPDREHASLKEAGLSMVERNFQMEARRCIVHLQNTK